jgi:hypothetical protein
MRKLTIEFIRTEFAKEGYKLLTKNYVNAHQKLRYKCPNGHIHSISWSKWQQGERCSYCAGQGKPTIEFIRSEFAKEGYTLLTTEYKNNAQKLDYVCLNGHKHNIIWNNWQQGERCYYCAINETAAKNRLSVEFIRSEFEKEKYKLLTIEYKNAFQKLNYICPKGHKHSITWANWQQGYRCPYCFGSISKNEVEVRNFVESLDIEVSPNDRNQIFNPNTEKGLELDIFMPTLNKAIEYNGEYWHQDKSRDLLKQELCELKNIVV